MIFGRIDEYGRALLDLSLRATPSSASQVMEVWVDTGFTGDLVLPESLVNQLGLAQSAIIETVLADGSQSELVTYSCAVDWFGETYVIEVIANQGHVPLLGVGLL